MKEDYVFVDRLAHAIRLGKSVVASEKVPDRFLAEVAMGSLLVKQYLCFYTYTGYSG